MMLETCSKIAFEQADKTSLHAAAGATKMEVMLYRAVDLVSF